MRLVSTHTLELSDDERKQVMRDIEVYFLGRPSTKDDEPGVLGSGLNSLYCVLSRR